MSIVLSICIPTYNRSKFLIECLNSVLNSVLDHKDNIEIIISDNASTDDTFDIVSKLKLEHPWIRYHRNDINIGGERNFRFAAALARGKYIWIFGDDDVMEVDAASKVLQGCHDSYDLIICNCSIWDKQMVVQLKSGLHDKKNLIYNDPNQILKLYGLHLGYISSVIIKKSLFFKLPSSEYESFVDYGFPFMYSVYAGIIDENCQAIYIPTPIVRNRSGNSGNYDWYKFFVTGSSLIFEALVSKGYDKSAASFAKHAVLRDFVIPNVLQRKLFSDQYKKGIWGLMFRYYKLDWLFWVVWIPVFLIPTFLVRFAKNVSLTSRRVRAHI